MTNIKKLRTSSALSTMTVLAVSIAAFSGPAAYAQEEQVIEEILITGSHIRRKNQEDSPSPLNVMDITALSAQGLNSVGDIARNMTFNVGAELNTDSFTQNFSTGTANVNLRGLGLSSTLVLINGRRQTLSGAYADDGSTFVDTNTLMPMIMLGRVETVKDGASAIYGTDAVAGVVNYITRKNFTGFEVQGRAQTTTSGPQNDFDFGAIWGSELGDDAGHFVIGANFTKRTRLGASDRSDLTHRTGVSSAGQPGTIFIKDVVKHPVTGVTLPIIDPGCTDNPNSFKDVLSPASGAMPLDIGFCKFDFSSFYDMVPEETRLQTMATLTYDISDTVEMNLEAGYSRNKADRNVAPSFPMAEIVPAAVIDPTGATLPWIPQPLNAFISGYNAAQITAGNPAGMIRGVGLLHRPLGMVANKAITKNSAFRFAGGLKGDISDAWQWDFNATYSTSQFFLSITDAKRDAYTAALLTGKFNPFSTNMTTHKNSQAAIDAVIADVTVDGDTSLFTVDGVISGELAEFGDNMIMAAYGVQYRSSTMKYDWNDVYNGANGQGGNLMFLYGGADFEGTQNVYSVFAELSVPLGDTLELMLAGRYENYGGGINSFDPKASLLWRPNDRFSARASFSTAFRAPSLFNTIGQQTSLSEITLGNVTAFRPVTSYGNLDLKPETSNIYNVGFTWEVVEDFTFGIDYWRFEFTNLITQESPQAVIDAALGGDASAFAKLDFGTPGDLTTLTRIRTDIINAPTVTTDGLDINFGYKSEGNEGGLFHIAAESTYIFKYSATDQRGVKFEGAGNRNYKNFARSMPRLRGNINAGYARDNYSANVYLRYIDSYHDDQNSVKIPSYTTVDLQFGYLFGDSDTGKGLGITVGVINAFDKDIPRVATNGGFDSKVHDPRQRMVYISAKYSF